MNWQKITSETRLEGVHHFCKVEANGPLRRITYCTGFANKREVSFAGFEKPDDLQTYTHYMIITPPKD